MPVRPKPLSPPLFKPGCAMQCCMCRYLADQGRADPKRLCISGGSAGGYTTLAALAFKCASAVVPHTL